MFHYFLKRLTFSFLVVFTAASTIFFLPKFSPRNPVREKLAQEAMRGGYLQEGMDKMVVAYETKFGLDRPIWDQYIDYLSDLFHFDLGSSIVFYPKPVLELIGEALPWTIGLLSCSTIIAFIFGSFVGALVAWPRASKILRFLTPSLVMLSSIPYYLLGLALFYLLAFKMKWFPLGGGFSFMSSPEWSLSFIKEVLYHAALPAGSIVIAQAGTWAIGMRGIMVTIMDEDYMRFAEARGLKDWRVFYYGFRNALLPQTTILALALGHIVSNAILVELVFGYPGIGTLLLRSINSLDYFVIYGVVYVIILVLAAALLVVDLVYPLLDPRVAYE
ncbi:MAG: ABC transporter permease [Desulfobulbaceae bacterium]|nr:ABC transporter permease [Desulfobulbaceae bacterium]MDP2105025.1 ABC transporter permease [Desulfobulbaceae bacterium]